MGDKKKKKKSNDKPATKPKTDTDRNPAVDVPKTDQGFEGAWYLYNSALIGWTESAMAFQKAAAESTLSWFEMWRRAVDMDTEVLKSANAYWEDKMLHVFSESAKEHLKSAVSATAAQADSIRDIQLECLQEYNRQCARLFRL